MGRWLFMLGGLIVWTAHFFGVYALASLGEVFSTAAAPTLRWAVTGFSLACLLIAIVLSAWAGSRLRRRRIAPAGRLEVEVAAFGGGLAALAILWQALPAWF